MHASDRETNAVQRLGHEVPHTDGGHAAADVVGDRELKRARYSLNRIFDER
jgi:hypothetical protein